MKEQQDVLELDPVPESDGIQNDPFAMLEEEVNKVEMVQIRRIQTDRTQCLVLLVAK